MRQTKGALATGLIAILLLAAAAQAGVLYSRLSSQESGYERIKIGEVVPPLEVVASDRGGESIRWSTARLTILLVFHPECGFCERVAPAWRDWINQASVRGRVLLITADSPSAASHFATRHDWNADLYTLPPGRLDAVAGWLSRRSPWIYVVANDRTLIYEGHGAKLAELDDFLGNTTPRP